MKNVYLGYVSLNNRDDLNLYQTDLGDIEARYTNEAGLKYAAEKLKQDHRKLDQAIFICSPAVRKSAKLLPYLKELASQMPDCEYLEIDTEDELNIYDDIPKILSCIHPDDRLFIDMTGGFRVTSVPMMLVCNYLQRRGNITEAEIYSSLVNAPDGSKVGTIKSDTAGQRVMRLIDGIEEFATSARVNTLQAALADSENEHIIQLLKAMKSFSESIMLGKVNLLEENMLHLKRAMSDLEEDDDSDAFTSLFKSMLPLIKSKFFSTDEKKVDPLHLIRWCVENELLQQALVLCVEKLPDVLMDNNMIEYTGDKTKIKKQAHENLNSKLLYDKLLGRSRSDAYKNLDSVMKKMQGKDWTAEYDAFRIQKSKYPELKRALDVLWDVNFFYSELQQKPNKKIDKAYQKACDYVRQKGIYKSAWYCLDTNFKEIIFDIAEMDVNEPSNDIMDRVPKIRACLKRDNYFENFKFHIPTAQLETILVGSVYLKYVRNQISHVGRYEELTGTTVQILKDNGFLCEYTEEAISKNIMKTVETIEQVEI